MKEELKKAIQALHNYCKNSQNCGTCEIKRAIGCCGPFYEEMEGLPRDWDVQKSMEQATEK